MTIDRGRRQPLRGVRVLDLSRLYPGAFCTSLLADLGADVVKVEAPGVGDMLRMMTPEPFKAGHVALNRGKRSLALDLKSPLAADVVRRLADRCDVLVESHRPGALEAMELGYDDLSARNPGLVWCSLTGFGSDGPLATAAGHDLTYVGASGVLSLLTQGGDPPVPQTTLALQAGALMGVVGILAALNERASSGRGMRVDSSLTDAARWFISEDVARAANAPGPGWPSFASRAVYRCADGRHVTVTASEPKAWTALCAALGLPELTGHRIGVDEERAITALTERFATAPAAHWLSHPGAAGGVGPVNTPADVLHDAQLLARDGIVTLDGTGDGDGGTPARVLANPLRLRDRDGVVPSTATAPAPAVGEHADAILAEAGFSLEEIAALRDARAL
jgi:alpha-methylacyl-CoA racemase